MGLDMYLKGEKLFWSNYKNPGDVRMEDGERVASVHVDLGYWRKHPNLHGFVVQRFAGGVDECQEIELSVAAIVEIIDAVKRGILPPTTGFFFGTSDDSDEQVAEDIRIFEHALAWLNTGDQPPYTVVLAKEFSGIDGIIALEIKPSTSSNDKQRVTRRVYYQASW